MEWLKMEKCNFCRLRNVPCTHFYSEDQEEFPKAAWKAAHKVGGATCPNHRAPGVGWFWQLNCKQCRAAERRTVARDNAIAELLERRKDTWAKVPPKNKQWWNKNAKPDNIEFTNLFKGL